MTIVRNNKSKTGFVSFIFTFMRSLSIGRNSLSFVRLNSFQKDPFVCRSFGLKRLHKNRNRREAKEVDLEEELEKRVDKTFLNEEILEEADVVMLIDENGNLVAKEISSADALSHAKEKGMDLLMVDPKADIQVVKLLKFEDWLERNKNSLEESAKNSVVEVRRPKEVRFGINIGPHDAKQKTLRAISLLEQGYTVRMLLQFQAPIPYDKDVGEEFLMKLLEGIPDEMGTCSDFHHFSGKGEVLVHLNPINGPTKGRKLNVPKGDLHLI